MAIVLFGGVSIFGGKGTMGGVVLAVLVFCGIQNVLLLTNFNQEGVGVVTGGLLLLSVLAPSVAELRSRSVHYLDRLRRRSLADAEPGP